MGDGCADQPARLRSGDDRRGRQRGDHHPARARPQRRAAGAVPAAARRRAEASQPDHRVRPEAQRPVAATPGRRSSTRPAASPRRSQPRPMIPTIVAQLVQGQRRRSSPAGPTSPSIRCEVGNGVLAALAAGPGRQGAAGAAPRQHRRRDRDGPATRRRVACTPSSIADAAAAGKIECLVLLGCDPLADFPDTDLARRMMAGAPRIIAIDTFLTEVERARRRRAAPRRPTARSAAPRPTSRAGSRRSPRRSRRAAPADPTG